MKTRTRRSLSLMGALLLLSAIALTTGCSGSNKEDTATGGSYYTGPMAKKGGPAPAGDNKGGGGMPADK